jgi:predicted dehydrogenase
MIANGAIGDVQCFKTLGMLSRNDKYFSRNDWVGRLKVGDKWVLDSPFNNAVAHFLMMMRFLAGPVDRDPRPVRVEAGLYHAREIESVDTATIRIRMGRFAPIYFFGSHCGRTHREAFAVVRGARGEIRWEAYTVDDDFSERVVIRRDGHRDEIHETGYGKPLRNLMIQNVCAVLRGESAPVCTADEAIAHTRCVQMIHDSATIKGIPSEFLERGILDGSPATFIKGVNTDLDRAFESEKLLSELGVPWA